MTSKENLERVLKSNKAKKVKQLSEIAALFEKEQRINGQIEEVEQFRKFIDAEMESSAEFRKMLPRNFLEQENNKRSELLDTAMSFQLVAETQVAEIRGQQLEENEKLARLDNVIDRVDKEVRRQKSIENQIREITESEEHQQNV